MRRLIVGLAFLVVACSGGTTASTETPTRAPSVETTDNVEPLDPQESTGPTIARPGEYKQLSARAWRKLVKSPDRYLGNGYQVWACITQFDAATGEDAFRGQAAHKKLKFWYSDAVNAFFSGNASQLEDFVEGDIVSMKVTGLGSYSYDTQAGGNTTAPLFLVDTIKRAKGSCD